MQPDFSIPNLPEAETPEKALGHYVGTSNCEAAHLDPRPDVPYGEQNKADALWFEEGYKKCMGYLTKDRSLVFERQGLALENPGDNKQRLTFGRASESHANIKQRWVIHYTEDEESQIFKMSSALDGRLIGREGKLVPASDKQDAARVKITFLGSGRGYKLAYEDGESTLVDDQKTMKLQDGEKGLGFDVWSVTYRE